MSLSCRGVIAERTQSWLERVDGRFMGVPLDVTPEEAVIGALHLTAGEVAYCNEQIARLTDDELFERPARETYVEMPSGRCELVEVKVDPEQLSRWVQIRDSAIDRMAKYARMAAEMGVEERTIALAERQSKYITDFVEQVLEDIELTPRQHKRLGPAMRRHLELLEGGKVA